MHCYYISTKVQMGLACYCLPLACYWLSLTAYSLLLLPLTRLLTTSAYPLACYRLPFTHAACRCCPLLLHPCVSRTGSPTHVEYGIAFAIADPCRIRDRLHMLARHVKAHALITPAPGSIPRLSQLPLKKGRAWSPWPPICQPTARSPCLHALG